VSHKLMIEKRLARAKGPFWLMIILLLLLLCLKVDADVVVGGLPLPQQDPGSYMCVPLAVSWTAKLVWDLDLDPIDLYTRRDPEQGLGMSVPEALSLAGIPRAHYIFLSSITRDLDRTAQHLLEHGQPVIINLPWPNPHRPKGWHCVVLVGYSEDGYLYANWDGIDWGTNGYATWPYEWALHDYAADAWLLRRVK